MIEWVENGKLEADFAKKIVHSKWASKWHDEIIGRIDAVVRSNASCRGNFIVNNFLGGEQDMRSNQISVGNISGQVGSIGIASAASGISLHQSLSSQSGLDDLPTLAQELTKLRMELKKQAVDLDHDQAVVEVGRAAVSAQNNNPSEVVGHLRAAGTWALQAASTIGTTVAAKAIESALSLK